MQRNHSNVSRGANPSVVVYSRLPVALVEQLDRYCESAEQKAPGASCSRTAAMKHLLTHALSENGRRR